MTAPHLDSIAHMLALQFERKQQRFREVIQREASLRNQLGVLASQEKSASGTAVDAGRLLGADLAWHQWLEKTRKDINRELAQVLAQKEQMLHLVRKDYGKLIAARKLSEAAQTAASAQIRKAELDNTLSDQVARQAWALPRRKG